MPPTIKFDQTALPAGIVDRSRDDIVINVAVTITAGNVVGTAVFGVLGTSLPSSAALSGTGLTRSLTPDVDGRYRIRVVDDNDGSEVIHTFTVKTALGQSFPAFNERADATANDVDADPGTWVNSSETNQGGSFEGWHPSMIGNLVLLEDAIIASGDFIGPAGSVSGNIVSFGNTTGKLGADSGVSASAVSSHLASTSNPHSTSIANIGSGTLAQLNAAVSDATLIDQGRTLTAGAGLTGGGSLAADRTFDVAATDASIVVGANSIAVGVLQTDAMHGLRGGGTQHAVATPSVAGFQSAADKTAADLGPFLPLGGGTMSGAIAMGTNDITSTSTLRLIGATGARLEASAGGVIITASTTAVISSAGALTIEATANSVFITATSAVVTNAWAFPALVSDTFQMPDTHGVAGSVLSDVASDGVLTFEMGSILSRTGAITGILTGGEITVNGGDPNLYDVAAGVAQFADFSNPLLPVITRVSFNANVGVSPLASQNLTRNSINSSGTLVKSTAADDPTQRRNEVILQSVSHPGGVISSFSLGQNPAYNVQQALLDYVKLLGAINTGNEITAASTANLRVTKAPGTQSLPFINYINDHDVPNDQTNVLIDPASMLQSFIDSGQASGFNLTFVDDVPVGFWDDGSDTLAATTQWVNYYFYFAGITLICVIGQAVFAQRSQAEAARFPGPLKLATITDSTLRTVLTVKGNVTDLLNDGDVGFFQVTGPQAGGSSSVFSVFGRTGVILASSGDYTASQVTFVPDGDIAAIETQAAIVEVRDDTDTKLGLKADSAIDMTAGAGLTGGGTLAANRTFDVVANADGSMVVNADDIQVGILATDAQHGVRGGGTQHAVATGSVSGFMSSTDKTAFDLGPFLPLGGGTLSGALNMGAQAITNAGAITSTAFSGPLSGDVNSVTLTAAGAGAVLYLDDAGNYTAPPGGGGGNTLQQAYAAGNTIAVTTANGSVAISNSADATNTLEVSRTFVGAGIGLEVSMGPGNEAVTGVGLSVVNGTGATGALLRVNNFGTGDALDVRNANVQVFTVDASGAVAITTPITQDIAMVVNSGGVLDIDLRSASLAIRDDGGGLAIIGIGNIGNLRLSPTVSQTLQMSTSGVGGNIIIDSTADVIDIRQNASPRIFVDIPGAIDITPAAAETFTVTTFAGGDIDLVSGSNVLVTAGSEIQLDSAAALKLFSNTSVRVGGDAASAGAWTFGALADNVEFTMPTAIGSAGDVMTDVSGDGVLTFETPAAGGGDFTGPGSSTSGNLVSFADGTGKLGADSGVLASDVSTHLASTANPHATDLGNIGTGTLSELNAAVTDATLLADTRTLFAGQGLTGGGDLTANRTFNVVANADGSIAVNVNDIQVGVLATDAQHGARGGGTQHDDVVLAGASGFMTGAQATKLDDIETLADVTDADNVAGAALLVNAQTGTTYIFVNADNGKLVTLSNAGAITATLNTGLMTGFHCAVEQLGAGQVTFNGTATLTHKDGDTKTEKQRAVVAIMNEGPADDYVLAGATAA